MLDSFHPLAAAGRLLGAAVLTVALQFPALADSVEDSAEEDAAAFLVAFFDDFNAYVSNDSLSDEESLAEFRRLLNAGFHLDTMSAYVLDEHWQKADESQKSEFRAAFEDFIIVTYGKHVPNLKPMDVTVVAAREKKPNLVQLRSNVTYIPNTGEKFVIDYALQRKDEEWGIVNLRIQGFTPTAIHRSEFTSYADNNGVAALLALLREKNAKLSPDVIKAAN